MADEPELAIVVSLDAKVRRLEAAWRREPWFSFMIYAARAGANNDPSK